METNFLEKLGLTKGEVKVFNALNRLGESTVGPLTTESQVSKSKIYDLLEKLISKGLAGYTVRENTKFFFLNDPSTIVDYVNKKEIELKKTKEEIENALPNLLAQRNAQTKNRIAEIYEGFSGLRTIREELLMQMPTKSTLLVLGAPTIANEKWESWLLQFHKKRLSKQINMKILYNADAKKYGSIRKKMKNTLVRYLPEKVVTPTWIDIFDNAIMIGIAMERPVAFVVRDKTTAESMKNYFEVLWQTSTEN